MERTAPADSSAVFRNSGQATVPVNCNTSGHPNNNMDNSPELLDNNTNNASNNSVTQATECKEVDEVLNTEASEGGMGVEGGMGMEGGDPFLQCQDAHCRTHEDTLDGCSTDVVSGNPQVADYFCTSCDVLLCTSCQYTYHKDHELSLISEARKNKQKYIDELLNGIKQVSSTCGWKKEQLRNLLDFTTFNVKQIMLKIESRAAKLCEVIQQRKQHLLDELRELKKYHVSQYEIQLQSVEKLTNELFEADDFASILLSHGEDTDVLTIGTSVCDDLHKLLNSSQTKSVDICSIKLEECDETSDLSGVKKMFGSIAQSVVRCGEVTKLASFNTDLPWPTGMAVSGTEHFVVAGKIGALEEKGKIVFYNRNGKKKQEYILEEGCIPLSAYCDKASKTVLVTDSKNQIRKYDPNGKKCLVMKGKFRGTGRVCVSPQNGNIIVTSSEDKKVFVYDQNWQKFSIPSDDTVIKNLHSIDCNIRGDIVVSDFEQNVVFTFDSDGKLLFTYYGSGSANGALKCPSAVCCDTFGNILVADFMNDRVHLVSKTGQFLGYLLTKENGITCPNFMTLDHENNLYVGQYGGEIHVFRYLSVTKHI